MIALAGILVAQAIWSIVLLGRGWYLQSEISNLADARSSGLTAGYLTRSLGGHLSPVVRLEYWVLSHVAPLNYPLTIAVRVIGMLACTYLLWRLLTELIGSGWLPIAVAAGYAATPLTVPGAAWLTSAVALVPSTVTLLLSLLALVRFARTGSTRAAMVSGLWLALTIFAGSETIPAVVVFPILVLGFLYEGTLRERLTQLRRHWTGWLVLCVPAAGFILLFLAKRDSYAGGAHPLSVGAGLTLLRNEWLRAVGPVLVGGPWRWYAGPDTYIAFAAPPTPVVIAGQVTFVVLVLTGFTVSRWSAVLAWTMPLATAAVSVLLVGIGRFAEYGQLIPLTLRYSYVVAVPLAMAVALSYGRPVAAPTAPIRAEGAHYAEEPSEGRQWLVPRRSRRAETQPSRALLPVLGALLLASSVMSSWRFTDALAANPTHGYVSALRSDLARVGPKASLWDTPLPNRIVSPVEPHHHVSDLLDLAGLKASFTDPSSVPLIVDGTGHLKAATFVNTAVGVGARRPNCGFYLGGAGRWRIDLSTTLDRAEWFLQLSLYQSAPTTIEVQIVDDGRALLDPVGGRAIDLTGTLAQINRRLPLAAPTAVVVSSEDPHTSICLSAVGIGAPFPVGTR